MTDGMLRAIEACRIRRARSDRPSLPSGLDVIIRQTPPNSLPGALRLSISQSEILRTQISPMQQKRPKPGVSTAPCLRTVPETVFRVPDIYQYCRAFAGNAYGTYRTCGTNGIYVCFNGSLAQIIGSPVPAISLPKSVSESVSVSLSIPPNTIPIDAIGQIPMPSICLFVPYVPRVPLAPSSHPFATISGACIENGLASS
jgi:hypothetical protein